MTILLNSIRKTLGSFANRAAEQKAHEVEMDAEQTRGFKRLISDALRYGGPSTDGFYDALPSGDGDTVTVTEAQIATATANARDRLTGIIPALAAAGTAVGTYSTGAKAAKGDRAAVKGHNVDVDIDTADLTPFTGEEMDALLALAASGATKNKTLAALDF